MFRHVQVHGGVVSNGQVMDVSLQITRAVSYMHGKGIWHRDLHAGNVLLSGNLAGHSVVVPAFGGPGGMSPGQAIRPNTGRLHM